jgi:hypothetical protein
MPAKPRGKKPGKRAASKPAAPKPTAPRPTASKPTASKRIASKPTAPKRAATKPAAPKRAATKPSRKRKGAPEKSGKTKSSIQPLDLSAFPSESVIESEKWLCLACILDVFTRHLGLALKTAHLEIKRYTPSIDELYAPAPMRPFFEATSGQDSCPYCGSPLKWHARFRVYRIESGKATDALRRALVKSLPKSGDQFVLLEQKATGQHAFFEWIDKTSAAINFDDPGWLRELSRHYLSRKEPKVDWQTHFNATHSIRRSRRIETGFEVDQGRLFLSPTLFDELLLVQYLASRSQKAGGLTLEGRYTLPELFSRLRNAGYLRAVEVQAHNPSDALEQLLDHLSGGETALKFYHLVDRRELLEKAKAVQLVRPPKPKTKP